MSWIALLLISIGLFFVISQFGNRLAARNSIVWWSVAFFIIVVAIAPDLFRPLIGLLGIKLVSNFVLAGLIMFLFLQVLELTAESTQQSRRIRQLVSSQSADGFVLKVRADLQKQAKYKVLVVLPCYNEEEAIPHTLAQLSHMIEVEGPDSEFSYKLCFVNDGSSDNSLDILSKTCPDSFASHSVNIGVAGALMTGFEISKRMGFDFVVQFDGDGQHPADMIPDLLKFAVESRLDLVIGSRFVRSNEETNALKSTTRMRVLGIALIRRMLALFGRRAKIYDPTSGFRVYSRKAQKILAKHMPDEYPEPESIALLLVHGATIGEKRVEMEPRSTGVSSISGIKTLRFMTKVLTALVGLRMRTLRTNRS